MIEEKQIKGLHVGDHVFGITFNTKVIEKNKHFAASKKELIVTELIDDNTVKFSPVNKDSDSFTFRFETDSLDRLYKYNDDIFTGLFTKIENFQSELNRLYENKVSLKLNELLDKFATPSKDDKKQND